MIKEIDQRSTSKRSFKRMTLWALVIFFSLGVFIELYILLGIGDGKERRIGDLTRSQNISIEQFRSAQLSAQLEILDEKDKGESFEDLKNFVMLAYPDEPPDKHELGHKLGEIAFKELSFDAFGFCDTFLNYGCFHGVALTAVRHYGLKPELSEKLWIGCKKGASKPGRCLHGLGHVIMMLKQYDLLASYRECEELLSENDSFWCQDGVAMENIERRLADPDIKPYGSDEDPYYPCNAIPETYEAVCARNHLQFAQRKFSLTLQESIAFCLGFKMVRSQEECIGILGSLLADDFFNEPSKIIELCGEAGKYKTLCIRGAAHVFVVAKNTEEAEKLCNSLIEGSEQGSCMNLIHSIDLE